MSFSNEWDERYKANTHLSIWPWSDLVSYVMRYARPQNPSECKVLEIGCGAGANISFFQWLGVQYYAVDGSPSIVTTIKKKFPEFSENIKVGDFTKELPFDEKFDIIIDRASLTHNNSDSIRRALEILNNKMKNGAKFIGIDWFSTNHSDYKRGLETTDSYTKNGYKDGQFTGVGDVHFSDQNHLIDLFKKFEIKMLEEKVLQRKIPNDEHIFASWNFYAIRR
jgi:SAM-dependent methyltransferase